MVIPNHANGHQAGKVLIPQFLPCFVLSPTIDYNRKSVGLDSLTDDQAQS